MINIGILDRFKKENKLVEVSTYKMFTDEGSGFFGYDGNIYKSDVVRSAIRPKVRAIGKAVGKHIRENVEGLKVNPEPYIRFLLEEPNPYMTGQQLQEKLATQLELNNNAFAYINRDNNDMPIEVYPITSTSTQSLTDSRGRLYLRFSLRNGNQVTFRYTDIIHLRKDFNEDDLFGTHPGESLAPLMEIVTTTDQGIVKAIKNSGIIKWLLKFTQTLRPEDQKREVKRFVDDYLNTENDSLGVAATDAKADAVQVEPKDYVPNEKQMDLTTKRIYNFFNTNEKIVASSYNENEWVSYYEGTVEADIIQLSDEFTRKLFTRRERGHGNKIMFESSNLAFASLKTKMDFVNNGIDRGYVNANEGRNVFGMAPIEGGDQYVRRLDTAPVEKQREEVSE
ncbi:phage portal protein [Oceanobacillus profundus]|nr:phage portal protein [Oceanobacillus profundus]